MIKHLVMKKLTFFAVLFMAVGMVSCSSDDSDNDSQDKIVGTWRLESSTYNGEIFEPDECELMSSMTFHANGNLSEIEYYEDFNTGECVLETDEEETSQTWEHLEGSTYRITITYSPEEVDVETVEIVFSGNNRFTVSGEDEFESWSNTYVRI